MNVLDLINIGSTVLKKKNISSHILDSEILLSKTLKKSREEILINLDQKINKKKILKYKRFLDRRSKYEPIAYILKEKEFWSKKFIVNKDTLIPRPETELLVNELVKAFKDKSISILDIGTGSGCIIVSLLSSLNYAKGVGIDISKAAISIAKKNRSKHKLENRLKFYIKPLERVYNQKFDLIVSNPPYILRKDIRNLNDDIKRYEPIIALDGGNDGLDLIKKVIYKSKHILKRNGSLALEIGNEQFKKVSRILFDNKFKIKRVIKDYRNNIRCIITNYNQ